ncbi:MAG: SIMPL domain-containing protein [Methanomicrobiales archaeon]|nr:SIMPL domain-containing protein [Methanomicrobiales archaeon]
MWMTRGMMLLILALLGAALMGSTAAQPISNATERLIHAASTGEAMASPDRVRISLAVETDDPDARAAQQGNAERANRVIEALLAAGLGRNAINTTAYTILPVYSDGEDPINRTVRSYRVTNSLLVTLENTSRAGEILDAAVAGGANRIDFIEFGLSEERERQLRTEALQRAVRQTRSDAETAASAAGLAITGVKEIAIDEIPGPTPIPAFRESGAAASVPTPIQPGDVTVSARVSAIYSAA